MARVEHVEYLTAGWHAPARVRAVTTLRRGGVSRDGFKSLNLGSRTRDDPGCVAENRRRLRRALELPAEPAWLRQVHGGECVRLEQALVEPEADGSFTETPGRACAVLTADCLPLFVCDDRASRVGLFHVGWRGLATGIVERALTAFEDKPGIHCWLGPAIGPGAFEVGPEVRDALALPGNEACFRPSLNAGRFLADLYGLVAHRLERGGVKQVDWDADACTYGDPGRFFSHRRDPQCGRMASLIWIAP